MSAHGYGNSLTSASPDYGFEDDDSNNHANYGHADAGVFDGDRGAGTYRYDPTIGLAGQQQHQQHQQEHQILQSQEDFNIQESSNNQIEQNLFFFGTNPGFESEIVRYQSPTALYQNPEQQSQTTMMYSDLDYDTSHLRNASNTPAGRIYTGQPYAKLIHKALISAPGHRMVLRDIYRWFEVHTDKTTKIDTDKTNKNIKGWQNSIRHNLSMNAAFIKEETRNNAEEGKRSNVWRLASDAIDANNLLSTTRFRKPISKKTPLYMNQQHYRVNKPSCGASTSYSLGGRHHAFNQILSNNTGSSTPRIKQERSPIDTTIPQSGYTPWTNASCTYPAQSLNAFGPFYTPSVDYGYQTELSTPAYLSRQSTVLSEDFAYQPSLEHLLPFEKHVSPVPSMTNTQSSLGGNEPAELESLPAIDDWTNMPSIVGSLEQQSRRTPSTELYNSAYDHSNIVNSMETR